MIMATLDGCTFTLLTAEFSTFIGANFSKMNYLLSTKIRAKECDFTYASFQKAKLSESQFIRCKLVETAFNDAIMQQTVFAKSDLSGTIFHNADLRKSDFRGAKNYAFNPAFCKLRLAKFSKNEVTGLLSQFEIDISDEEPDDDSIEML
jgi:uncharacterized protein YjbI with pentapeptide repeats